MILLKEKEKTSKEIIEFDEYIPFVINIYRDNSSPHIYWRIGDGKFVLLEIALSIKGEIHSITLTSIHRNNVSATSKPLLAQIEEKGLPIFDVSGWINSEKYSDRFKDEFDSKLRLFLGSDYLSLRLEDDIHASYFLKNINIRFGFDSKNQLVSIDIMNINKKNIEICRSCVGTL